MTISKGLRKTAVRGALVLSLAALAGCSLFSRSDDRYRPAKLTDFTQEMEVGTAWTVSVGRGGGVGFAPAVTDTAVYAAAADGSVVKMDLASGNVQWRASVDGRLQAGVGSDGQTTAVVRPDGEVVAFDDTGTEKWRAKATSEVLIPPAVGEGLVVVRSGDYRIQAFDAQTGERRWSMQRPGPSLALRAVNQMLIAGGFVFSGLPGGKLVAMDTNNGAVLWEGTVAVPRGASELERVADVVGAPVVSERLLCAAAYQGRIACFDVSAGGDVVWARDFSGASGMTVDASSAFAADSHGIMNGFLLSSGTNVWRQDALANRRLSAPASYGRAVAVGDYQGYVHFLAREDGRLLARTATDGDPILAPLVATPYGVVVQGTGGSVRLLTTGG
ncbi:outer membrane protein assembly factor BamB [Verticiella sediminum]|uniref:Outer membrane protein assembly factor BamB n=1 Tax=Verticiella sediminum TaxID=1247510 RepID=A0A556ADT9_9BURK|nr:outer membrane protein assembly factor BamB [Verticiella sediminum]TSH91050.1 outer membrane protein assembly factor BamB [Verticiella sediminum]